MSKHGWIGAAILVGAEASLYAGNRFVATWFTPIMWTGYIVLADALIARRTGSSYLTRRRREFSLMALLSVLSWLIFEVYNFRLQNWLYAGVPENILARDIGLFWSFATITPAIMLTADLLAAFGIPPRSAAPLLTSAGTSKVAALRTAEKGKPGAPKETIHLSLSVVVGLACVSIPPLLPLRIASYTFAFVWVGFILLLEPLNWRNGVPSLFREWSEGRRERVWQFLIGGLLCGLMWEAWNYQAFLHDGGIWIYTIPSTLRIFGWHYGKMPVLGLLGFPPFAMEAFAIYHFMRQALFPGWQADQP